MQSKWFTPITIYLNLICTLTGEKKIADVLELLEKYATSNGSKSKKGVFFLHTPT